MRTSSSQSERATSDYRVWLPRGGLRRSGRVRDVNFAKAPLRRRHYSEILADPRCYLGCMLYLNPNVLAEIVQGVQGVHDCDIIEILLAPSQFLNCLAGVAVGS